jgi:dTDP-glucose pyrophosphorylase
MNILIPMAGLGKRFQVTNYKTIKPLIRVNEKPMIEQTINSLNLDGKYFFVIRKDLFSEELKSTLKSLTLDSQIIEIENLTRGAAETCLFARNYINNDKELIIANSDQIMFWDSKRFIAEARKEIISGAIVTYHSNSLKNSYAKVDESGYVSEIQEKKLISNLALTGIHYFRRGTDFVSSASKMIAENNRSKGEFYVGPCYNYMINNGGLIKSYLIPSSQYNPVGTPEDLKKFEDKHGSI